MAVSGLGLAVALAPTVGAMGCAMCEVGDGTEPLEGRCPVDDPVALTARTPVFVTFVCGPCFRRLYRPARERLVELAGSR